MATSEYQSTYILDKIKQIKIKRNEEHEQRQMERHIMKDTLASIKEEKSSIRSMVKKVKFRLF